MTNRWISQRCARTGHSINTRPSQQRKGPLRQIMCMVHPQYDYGMFDRPLVELECGHQVHSDGMHKARCNHCAKAVTS